MGILSEDKMLSDLSVSCKLASSKNRFFARKSGDWDGERPYLWKRLAREACFPRWDGERNRGFGPEESPPILPEKQRRSVWRNASNCSRGLSGQKRMVGLRFLLA